MEISMKIYYNLFRNITVVKFNMVRKQRIWAKS